ncbi:MAG TPA: class I SAM-dependent methyltransferase [Roseococcus sp.]|jgi:predicted O-methyltransferase YrrM|nr:class I SAM-dependent methyltransferase [Roseococcus sp.]
MADNAPAPPAAFGPLPAELMAHWRDVLGSEPPKDLASLVEALPAALARATSTLPPLLREELARHHSYLLAHKAFQAHARGMPDPDAPGVLADFLRNTASVLRDAAALTDPAARAGVPPSVLALIEASEAQLEGWCYREKSLFIAQLVLRERPLVCVEVGVYGGRSLIPCAAALQHLGQGRIWGVEGWSADVAVRDRTVANNDDWWAGLDFGPIKRGFLRFLAEHDLAREVGILEAPSAAVDHLFPSIDYLHIDGSHARLAAAEDVLRYGRRVRPGGIILFDDAHWKTTTAARELLDELGDCMDILHQTDAPQNVCAVYRRHDR